MKIRELIKELLDHDLDAEIEIERDLDEVGEEDGLELDDVVVGKYSGYVTIMLKVEK